MVANDKPTPLLNVSAALEQNQQAPLSKAELCRLEKEMVVWRHELRDGMTDVDAFRYECFSRRLMAAEQGFQSAVGWARNWHKELLAADCALTLERQKMIDVREEIRRQNRADIARGYSGNPHFQAFLDTLEDPEAELFEPDGRFNGWKYLVWIGPLIGAFERRKDLPDSAEERRALFRRELKSYAVIHAASRRAITTLPSQATQ